MRKFLPNSRQLFLSLLLVSFWLFITALFTAVPGDLMYFVKGILVNPRISSSQKITDLWQGYLRMQATSNCKKSVLTEQELLREITNSSIPRQDKLEIFADWELAHVLNCNTALPFKELKLLAQYSSAMPQSHTLENILSVYHLKAELIKAIDLSRHTGFKSQRALNSFTALALDLQDSLKTLNHSSDALDIYEQELKLASMNRILENNDAVAENYQQLFLAACLLSPEYDVCQNADRFNAKWNSVGSTGNPLDQLRLGHNLLSEILVYQGLLPNDQE